MKIKSKSTEFKDHFIKYKIEIKFLFLFFFLVWVVCICTWCTETLILFIDLIVA